MRLLILSDSDSPHTIKWVKSIAGRNILVGVFSIHKTNLRLYENINNIKIYDLGISRKIQNKDENNFSKAIYLKGIKKLKRIIKEFKPDVLHAHYASSYGFIGALTNFNPYFISVWGSDIFKFPHHSWLHKKILEFNLSKANVILATSFALKNETKKYTNKEIKIVPFGVDTEKYKSLKVDSIFQKKDFVIGTIKTLEVNYGLEYLIRAFKLLKDKYQELNLKLLIVGKGNQYKYLKSLVDELKIENDTFFTGYIENSQIVNYHNMLNIAVFPSLEESFGVSVIEASACEKPVVVSDVGGLPEVVEDNVTGFVIPKKNVDLLTDRIEKLLLDSELRIKLGQNGREKVKREFEWEICVDKMIGIYKKRLQ